MARTFTLLRTLGRGAHGAVHLAELRDDENFVQTLAVKRLLPEWSDDADLVARLKDEARLLAFLHHEHVVRVHGLTRIDGALAILMEPVEGVDLGRVVARTGPVAPRVVFEIVEAVADALDAAWQTVPSGQETPLRVVHRDIKPSNVMLTPRGGVKVMDFGVARATFGTREGETKSQQYGTARYMAPERWLHGEAEHKSDVFSLGVTLIEIATGTSVPRLRLSPDGFAEDVGLALRAIESQELRELATRMTAFSADDRPTAAEVGDLCRAAAANAPGPRLRVWAAEHVVPEVGAPVETDRTATVVQEDSASRQPTAAALLVPVRTGRARVVVALLAIALAALAAGIGWLWWTPAPPLTVEIPVGESVPVPVPVPVPAPVPVVVEPPPVPVEVAPTPRPSPKPAPEPVPAVVETPMVMMTFLVAEGLVAEVKGLDDIGPGRAAYALPANRAVEVRVTEGKKVWPCTIRVGSSYGQVTIRPEADGKCTQQ